ncbi:MAG TPA: maleylpyruvate isomerase family mycothiol-dependent enzyme, partial [Mycobacterium sp.]|nr:maleylpyruvate isomerase family mycothiol-dependent enzyme [Mycobacterium sp.]
DPRDVREGKPPDDPDAAIDWLNKGAQLIIDSVDRVGSETRVWTFIGARPCGWWIRRRLHEATVHRADAALALGLDYDLSPELAADGISEWIERVSVQARSQPLPLELGRTLHLHATDDGLGPTGEWTITSDREDGVSWSHEHGKGDAALRGPAKELLLAIVRRRTAADGGIEVLGDTAVWDSWLAHTPF